MQKLDLKRPDKRISKCFVDRLHKSITYTVNTLHPSKLSNNTQSINGHPDQHN